VVEARRVVAGIVALFVLLPAGPVAGVGADAPDRSAQGQPHRSDAGVPAPPAPAEPAPRGSITSPSPDSTPATASTPLGPATDSATSTPADSNTSTPTDSATSTPADATGPTPPDPARDVVGWEGGYWYNESANVDQKDGLSAAELERWTHLAQAHVEYLTGREFTADVTVRVRAPANALSEAEVRRVRELLADEQYRAWNELVAEAQFYRGERATAPGPESVTAESLLAGVLGFYDPSSDRLVVLREEDQSLAVDNATLHHELVHALQDQRYDLSDPKYHGDTGDERRGIMGLVEGHATYVELRYTNACRPGGPFRCVGTPADVYAPSDELFRGAPPSSTNVQPYTDGAALVAGLGRRGGLAAVDAAFEDPPVSTEQTIHPGRYPAETPAPLGPPGTARAGWRRFDVEGGVGNATDVVWMPIGDDGAARVGELGFFGTFAHQESTVGGDVIDTSGYDAADGGRYDFYNYTSPATEGWGNDRLIPYRRAAENGTEYGYVWETRWDTERDARQFRGAYLRTLDGLNARRVDDRTYVVPAGGFADAFYVERDGRNVTIVNGPTVADLADLRPAIVATPDEGDDRARESEQGDGGTDDGSDGPGGRSDGPDARTDESDGRSDETGGVATWNATAATVTRSARIAHTSRRGRAGVTAGAAPSPVRSSHCRRSRSRSSCRVPRRGGSTARR
jgi:hypothetical protein